MGKNGTEYVKESIPLTSRISSLKMISLWGSYPLNTGTAITGGVIALNSSLHTMIYGVIIGNLALMLYIGLLGQIGYKTGLSFSEVTKKYFGTYLSAFISLLMVITVFGWFNMNCAFPAKIIAHITGLNYDYVDPFLLLLFGFFVYAGIYGVEFISVISAPLFLLIVLCSYIIISYKFNFSLIMAPIGNDKLSITQVAALAVSSYADAGTLAPDYNRWSKSLMDSWLSVISAFPISNVFALVSGATFVGVYFQLYGSSSPFDNANVTAYIASQNSFGLFFAIVVTVITGGNGAIHALYNSALGASNVLRMKFKTMVICFLLVSLLVSQINIWNYILQWLSLLGLLVLPIGSALISVFFTKEIYYKVYSMVIDQATLKYASFMGMALGWSTSAIGTSFDFNFIIPLQIITILITILSTSLFLFIRFSGRVENDSRD